MRIKNDFSQGSVARNILGMAGPMILAQAVNVLYSIVDRIYIGRIQVNAFLALTGVGICFPIISMVMAFADLFGMGGGPLCSIERGRGNNEEAEKIMGNSFVLLILGGISLTALGLITKRPILYLFGASDATYPYADQYITIYLLGNIFVMISLGMNHFINAQGFGKIGMLTVALGAVTNIVLDPVFIFLLDLGVQGAAIATVISQLLSTLWVIRFLTGKKAILKLNKKSFALKGKRIGRILALGVSGFVMQFTNSLVQIFFNASLQHFGGDLYVGIMTIVNSIREFPVLPIRGLGHGAQPVMGFNYGAREYDRVRKCIKFTTTTCVLYSTFIWLLLEKFPALFIHVFTRDAEAIKAGIPVIQLFYSALVIQALQYSGQYAFVALGKAKHATFFSLFRKVILVIPLVIFLPRFWGLGSTGVFLAEPLSELIGGAACFSTMLLTIGKELKEKSGLP